ncbi:MAG: hflB, partial [Sedimentibacter sp.]|nr:hflB [Sedimentibacter sp.]
MKKSKYLFLTISFVVYNIIILIVSDKYSIPLIFFLPMLFYAVFMIKSMKKANKKTDGNSTMFPEESNETVSSTTYFEKKKTEEPKIQIGFDDVAGLEEIKDDLMDVIDFLNNEDKYKSMDAKVPRGILLYGPPGTGKTLIAKAIAGEAKATFIYSSGSEFVEKYVGVGAKRVRMIFERARKEA